jgi:hypothetical protein
MKSNQPVGKLLVSLGFVSEATLRDALGESLGKKSVDLSNAIIDPSALRLVPRELAKRHRLLPLDYDDRSQHLTIAIADVNDIVALDKLRSLHPRRLRSTRCWPANRKSPAPSTSTTATNCRSTASCTRSKPAKSTTAACRLSDEYSQPVVRLIDALLTDAVKRDASDMHFEPEANFLRIRYRIDGCCARSAPCTNPTGPPWRCASRSWRHEHRRNPRAAGRPHLAQHQRPPGRFPRRGAADHPRREHRAAHPRPPEGHRAARRARPDDAPARAAQADDRPPGRHHPGHRPDRQRQDHHAVLGAQPHQRGGHQHHDPRGSGRIPDGA